MTGRHLVVYGAVLLLAVGGLFVGAADLAIGEVWEGLLAGLGLVDGNPLSRGVVVDIRLPRIVGGILVGVALGMAGTGLSGVFRNRLADPYLLGVSSGAGLGFVIGTLASTAGTSPVIGVLAASIAGALVALLARRWSGLAEYDNGLVLIGVAANFVFLAWTLVLIFAVDSPRLPTFTYFVFGSLGTVTWGVVGPAVVIVTLAAIVLGRRARALDLIAIGDDSAQSLGVDVAPVVTAVLVAAGAATGASVALAGVVGFVGLLAPLAGRRLFGPGNGSLLPAAAGLGAIFVLVCDLVIRGLAGPVEVPLGVVTAAVGGPILIAMLTRRAGR